VARSRSGAAMTKLARQNTPTQQDYGSKHPYARAREGVTRKQHLLNRDGSIPSANVGGAHGAVSSDMRLFCSGPW